MAIEAQSQPQGALSRLVSFVGKVCVVDHMTVSLRAGPAPRLAGGYKTSDIVLPNKLIKVLISPAVRLSAKHRQLGFVLSNLITILLHKPYGFSRHLRL